MNVCSQLSARGNIQYATVGSIGNEPIYKIMNSEPFSVPPVETSYAPRSVALSQQTDIFTSFQ